jgi:HSP20 family protein
MRCILTELKELQFQQLFSQAASGPAGEGEWRPPTDVYETETNFIVILEIPGLRGDEIRIQFSENLLTIWGERRGDELAPGTQYIQMEINYGRFRGEISFYKPVNAAGLQARYTEGFLKVVLPKA